MSNLLLSVCLISYNHEDFIEQAIESVLAQKCDFEFELIVADDCSTDRTQEILKKYQERFPKKIKLILQQFNKGPAKNWLDLITEPNSKYIAYFEGDDYWTDPLKLQKQVDFLEANPEYVISYHDASVIDNEGVLIKESKLPISNKRDSSKEELMQAFFILSVSICYRNCIHEFPKEILKVANGDSFLTSLLGQHGKGKYLDTIEPAVYRVHPEGIWSNLSELNKLKRRLQFYFYMTQYYKRLDYPSIRTYYLKKFDKLFEQYSELAHQLKEKQHLAYAKKMYTKSICVDAKRPRLKRIIKMWLS